MLFKIFIGLAVFLAVVLLTSLMIATVGGRIRKKMLQNRECCNVDAQIATEFDGLQRELASVIVDELEKSLGVKKERLRLDDRFELELAIFKSALFDQFLSFFDRDRRTILEDIVLRLECDGIVCELDALAGSIRETVLRATLSSD